MKSHSGMAIYRPGKHSNSRMFLLFPLLFFKMGEGNQPGLPFLSTQPTSATSTRSSTTSTRSSTTSTRSSTQPSQVVTVPVSSTVESHKLSGGRKQSSGIEDLRDLSLFGKCFDLAVDSSRIPSFDSAWWNVTSTGPYSCWRYCQHLEPCETLAFHYLTSTCFLFAHKVVNTSKEVDLSPPDLYIGTLNKSCVEVFEEEQSIIDLAGALQLGKEGKGVMIESGSTVESGCLSIGAEYLDRWFLEWVNCSEGHEFVLRDIGNDGHFQIQYHQNTSLLINVTLFIDSLHHVIRLRLPNRKLRAKCSPKKFQIPHSTITNPNNAPIVLAGTAVTILCDPGYGLPSRDYYPYQVVTCPPDHPTTPGPCRRIPSDARGHYPRFCELYLMGFVLLSVVVVVVAGMVCLVIACNKSNKGRESRQRHESSSD